MVCIYCGQNTQVTNSRLQRRDNHTWRRRMCTACRSVFTTTEQPELETTVAVRTAANELTSFNRDKLFLSIYKSCEHRPTALADATGLTKIIIGNMLQRPRTAELHAQTIKDTAFQALSRFDLAAANVYAAYHV